MRMRPLKVTREAGELISAAEGAPAAADDYDQTARTLLYAGLIAGAWALAQEGLRLIGDRRDITWAGLTEIEINRKQAEIRSILVSASTRWIAASSMPR
jgi:hypothetical protein